jgi:hypothetical protein
MERGLRLKRKQTKCEPTILGHTLLSHALVVRILVNLHLLVLAELRLSVFVRHSAVCIVAKK